MLTKTEFFKRFSTVIPDVDGSKNSYDISFSHLSMDGAEEMHRYSVKECFYEHLEFPPFNNFTETTQYLEKLFKRMQGEGDSQNSIYWFVRRKSDNYLVGTACIVSLDYGRQSVEWGYGIDPDFWGHGYILQIQEILKDFVFNTLNLNRLHGITMVTNLRTIESVKAAGFLHEGIAEDFYCKDGKFIDGWRYAMTKSLFNQVQSANFSSVQIDGIEDVILDLLTNLFPENDITVHSKMEDTTGWDSLGHMRVIMGLKEKFGFGLSPSEIAQANSVKSIVEIIDSRKD